MKDVWIILVNYNGYVDTKECIESINRSIHWNPNIIVVDNGSSDKSIVELKEYQNQKYFILLKAEQNNGFSAGNNIGIKYAIAHGAKYILLLNNDTVITQDFVEPLVTISKSKPKFGAASCKIYYFKYPNRIWFDGGSYNKVIARAKHDRFDTEDSSVKGINKVSFITGCCMFMPVSVIKKVGLLDERFFMYAEDTDYCLKIIKNGYYIYNDSEHYIYHKVSASAGERSKLSQYYEIRNRKIIAKIHLNILNIITSTLYDLFFFPYKIVTGQYKAKIVIKALKDYYNGNFGKVEL